MKNRRILITSLAVATAVYISILTCCSSKTENREICIDNGKIRLGFDKKTGSVTCFGDMTYLYDFLDERVVPGSPWEIEFLRDEEEIHINAGDAYKFSFSRPDPLTLVLRWKRFRDPDLRNMIIEASVSLKRNKPLSNWEISVSNYKNIRIRQIIFPRISGLKDNGEEYLAVPHWMGEIMRNPRNHLAFAKNDIRKFEWTYPGLSLQCLALYNPDSCGFYAASNDSLVYIKNFSLTLDTLNTLTYRMHNFPSLNTSQSSCRLPYSGVIGSFKGDWVSAAEIYREWGSGQRWARLSRLKNELTPEWLENTALWIWNRGRSGNVLIPAADLKRRLALPVSVFWHWWHGCSYDDGFPEYVPPREGKGSFVSAISEAKKKGIRSIVYMNQRLWGTTTESWENENAAIYAVKNPDGKINTHVYNIFTNKATASMCLGTQFWKDKYASLSDSAVNTYNASGIYMDQACLALTCYDKNHGHPVGHGNYWFENFVNLSEQIRSKIPGDKQLVLAGEGAGEAWMPYLDAFLTLAVSKERYAGPGLWETIPFFQAVYHQFAITYGNYSSLLVPPYDELWPEEYAPDKPLEMLDKSFNKQFMMEQARSFVWGLQPTISNYQGFLAGERKDEIEYLMKLAHVRNKGLKYLLYGKFMRSPDIKSPEEEFDISRLSIYAGKQGESVTAFRGRFPILYSGTWLADDNDVGIALANISEKPVRIVFYMDPEYYSLPASGIIHVTDENGRKPLSDYSDNQINIDITLDQKDVCLIEITPVR